MTTERLFGPRDMGPADDDGAEPGAGAASGHDEFEPAVDQHAEGGLDPTTPTARVVADDRMVVSITPDRPIRTARGTVIATAPASDADTTVAAGDHPDPVQDAPMSMSSTSPSPMSGEHRSSPDDPDIRRWEATDTDVMDAIGRRPEPLAPRADVEVSAERDDERSSAPWYEIPLMLLFAFTLAFLLRTFVVQVFYVPSSSMVPTLEVNDRIATEKVTYQFREPRRGEVIVFAGDEPFSAGDDLSTAQRVLTGTGQFLGIVPVDAQDFVKRIIGLPGDTVEIVDGQVSVNGVNLDEPYAILDSSNGVWEVPEGKLFVMGDNRPNSGDSRTSLGYRDVDEIVGRVVARIWPLDRMGSVEGVDWDPIPEPG